MCNQNDFMSRLKKNHELHGIVIAISIILAIKKHSSIWCSWRVGLLCNDDEREKTNEENLLWV